MTVVMMQGFGEVMIASRCGLTLMKRFGLQ